MKVFIIDNYDSFTFNLYQFVGEILQSHPIGCETDSHEIRVERNDNVTLEEIRAFNPDRIIISPGPGSPESEAYFGVCARAITELGPSVPLLGVCLGMQGIFHRFGGKIKLAPLPMHGKTSPITHTGKGLFHNIPGQLEVMRYHSLIADAKSFPGCLRLTATTGDFSPADFDDIHKIKANGDFEIMGVEHREYPIMGIQFHPESFATEGGKDIIRNFLFP